VRRVALLGGLVAALALGPAANGAGAGRHFTIHTKNGVITRIGELRGAMRLGAAQRAFGPATAVDRHSDELCVVSWKRLRVRAQFVNLGLGSACDPNVGSLQEMTIRGPRFRTTRGIAVGSRSSLIAERHRDAEFRNGVWWITVAYLPFNEGAPTPTITATTRAGRVRTLKLWVGAAGE